MWGFYWWMPFYGMGMMLFMVVVVGLAVWGIARFTTDRRNRQVTGETPAGILEKRLARGEITALQFEELQQTLQKSKGNLTASSLYFLRCTTREA